MRHVLRRRISSLALAMALVAIPWSGPGAQSPPLSRALTAAQMEDFLLHAAIVRTRDAGGGITNSVRVTLSDGTLTHDAQIQTIDEFKPVFRPQAGPPEFNFTDSYRFNIAGYRLALLLGLDNVPMSVERVYKNKPAAFTWWIDDVMMDERVRLEKKAQGPDPERTVVQLQVMRVFDELVQNRDRNKGNLLWTADWKMWMIDHTRAFRTSDDLLNPAVLERIDRSVLDNMRALTREGLTKAMGKALTRVEIEALLKRRDRIVKVFEARIAERGEGRVLYTLPR